MRIITILFLVSIVANHVLASIFITPYYFNACVCRDGNTVTVELTRVRNNNATIISTLPAGILNIEIDFGDGTKIILSPTTTMASNQEFVVINNNLGFLHNYTSLAIQNNPSLKVKINTNNIFYGEIYTRTLVNPPPPCTTTTTQPYNLTSSFILDNKVSDLNSCIPVASPPTVTVGSSPNACSIFNLTSVQCEDVLQNNHTIRPATCSNSNGAVFLNLLRAYGTEKCDPSNCNKHICRYTTYSWSNGSQSKDLINVQPGNYSVTVTNHIVLKTKSSPATVLDSKNCSIVINITIPDNVVTVAPIPCNISVGNHTINPTTCNGPNGSVFLNLNGIYNMQTCDPSSCNKEICKYTTYSWSNGRQTKDLFNVQSGTYSVTVKNYVVLKSKVSPFTVFDTKICQEVISIIVPDDVFTFASVTCDISAGNHTIKPTTCNGSNGAIFLSLNDIYNTEICNQTICDRQICKYTTYLWSNGSQSKDLINLQQGNYSVTVKNHVELKSRTSPFTIFDTKICEKVINITISDVCDQECDNCISSFSPFQNEKYILSAWVKEGTIYNANTLNYEKAQIELHFAGSATPVIGPFKAKGKIIEGWQKIEETFTVPPDATEITIKLINTATNATEVFYDDIRVHPFNSSFKSFVYDPVTLRLMAELDERNYATQYEYDLEGKLIRVKKETERGIETIKETRYNSVKNP